MSFRSIRSIKSLKSLNGDKPSDYDIIINGPDTDESDNEEQLNKKNLLKIPNLPTVHRSLPDLNKEVSKDSKDQLQAPTIVLPAYRSMTDVFVTDNPPTYKDATGRTFQVTEVFYISFYLDHILVGFKLVWKTLVAFLFSLFTLFNLHSGATKFTVVN